MNRFKVFTMGILISALMLFGITAFADNTTGVASVKIPISVNAVISDSESSTIDPSSTEKFTFTLEPVTDPGSDDVPMPGQTELKLQSGQKGGFGPIEYTEPGTYGYRITQTKGSTNGMVYDDSVYDVLVKIFVKESGDLYGLVFANKDGNNEKVMINFENTVFRERQSEKTSEKESEKETNKKDQTTPDGTSSGSPSGSVGYGPKGSVSTGDTPNTPFVIMVIAGIMMMAGGIILTRKKADKEGKIQ